MILKIHLFSIPKMLTLYAEHEYLKKYLSEGEGNIFIIEEGASIADIERILKSNSIRFKRVEAL